MKKIAQLNPEDNDGEDLLRLVRQRLKKMSNNERIKFFSDILEGYCCHCGRDDSDSIKGCQCWNDE